MNAHTPSEISGARPIVTFEHWIAELLSQAHATDLCIQGTRGAYLLTEQSWQFTPTPWSDPTVAQAAALEWLSQQGLAWDARHPYLDWVVGGRVRAHLLLPPLTSQGFTLSLRKLLPGADTIHPSQRWGSAWTQVMQKWERRQALLIVGATGSGKTTLLRDLIESGAPAQERTVVIEDTPEIQANHPHWVPILTREANADGHGAVSARACMRQALRMRPDRLILGEVRGAEVLDLLQAANTGHRGIACTLHANSCRDALRRLELLAQLAHPAGLAQEALRSWIASSFQWIVFVENHAIRELCEIAGMEGQTTLLRPVILEARPAASWPRGL